MRYELTHHEWTAIKPMLPNKPRGVPRVNDRRVLACASPRARDARRWSDQIASESPQPRKCPLLV
jgi:transposase